MIWEVDYWENPWSPKARTQSVTTFLVEAATEEQAEELVRRDYTACWGEDTIVAKPHGEFTTPVRVGWRKVDRRR